MSACLRDHGPLALMDSADEGPFCSTAYDALDIRRVVLDPGLTGSPSLHIVLATSEALLLAALIGEVVVSLKRLRSEALDRPRPAP